MLYFATWSQRSAEDLNKLIQLLAITRFSIDISQLSLIVVEFQTKNLYRYYSAPYRMEYLQSKTWPRLPVSAPLTFFIGREPLLRSSCMRHVISGLGWRYRPEYRYLKKESPWFLNKVQCLPFEDCSLKFFLQLLSFEISSIWLKTWHSEARIGLGEFELLNTLWWKRRFIWHTARENRSSDAS